ncbi:MAG TPA: NADH-quinone oxidoreductase subunit N [Pirellulales bacterium]|jgi:NADH-quinone oxidoreductase subunit N|nr:NADH-quinone oxidoreductase subunit N [Pirellulales bacterium]
MTDSTTIYLLLPEIILIAAATLLCVVGAFRPLRAMASLMAFGAIVIAAVVLGAQDGELKLFSGTAPFASASGPLAVDLFGHTVRWAILAVGVVLVLITARPQPTQQRAEETASILLMLAGLMIAAAANELILLFVGLELVSIPTYIVLYVGRNDSRGQEAASKYFFLSILSSAVLLYGFSFLYGVAGSTRLEKIAAVVSAGVGGTADGGFNEALVPVALLLMFAGLAFRLAVVPFHFYAPDVYQGTSNANAGLLSTLPKIAGLAVLARILLTALPGWESLGWKVALVVSVLTMSLGNVLALWQNNIRRMLAYSSIAHAGYLLIGVAVALAMRTTKTGIAAGGFLSNTAGLNGLGAAMFYLAVYMIATLGAFAALVYLSRERKQVNSLDDIAGLNRTHPVVALAMVVFMFSLAGVPLFAGFWGKFSLLYSALTLDEFSAQGAIWLRPWFVGLALVAVLNAAIGAAYYLRVIGAMYFRGAEQKVAVAQRGLGPAAAMGICMVLVIGIGLLPGRVLDCAIRAGQAIGQPAMAHTAVDRLRNDLQTTSFPVAENLSP